MEKVLKILEEIKNASGKRKQEILEENKSNELLKEVLFFVYNPYIITGLSDKKINKQVSQDMERNNDDILKMFNYLKENHTGTDKDIYYIQSFIYSQPVEAQDTYKEIFTKNLKIGITSTTINKVWDKLIPSYDVQQGRKLCERIDKIKDEEIILTQKLDGLRCTARVENGNVQLFSRQGQIYEGLVELEQELSMLPDGCYDGELEKDVLDRRGKSGKGLPDFLNMPNYEVPEKSIINLLYAPMPSKDLFKQTTSIVNSDEKEKTGIDFFIYDTFPTKNFDNMETFNEATGIRKKKASTILLTTMGNTPHLKDVPVLYEGKFDSILIDSMLKQVLLCKQEGLMINLKDSPYEFKRSNNLIKVKKMYPADLKIIGFEEGTGKNKGTLGALIVNYKGFPVKVGSGFTDAERIYAWEHKTELIGTIVTVQYFEETTNKKDNSLSLRFPVFKRFSSEIRRRKVMTNTNNEYYVYIHYLDDVPFYIGYGKDRRAMNLWARKRRWKEYVGSRTSEVKIKYLETNLSEDKAKELEIKYQLQYRKLGYPIVGLIGNKPDEELKKLQYTKLKGQKRTDEQKVHYRQATLKRMSEGFEPPKSSWIGRHHTQESKDKISKANKGKKGMCGEDNPMYGKTGKQNPNSKPVNVYYLGKFIQSFESAKDAERFTGVKQCRAYCRGVSNHRHKSGYSFYYKNEETD